MPTPASPASLSLPRAQVADTARALEDLTDEAVVADGLAAIRTIFPNAPDPVQTNVTRWAQDPFTLGSYSYFATGNPVNITGAAADGAAAAAAAATAAAAQEMHLWAGSVASHVQRSSAGWLTLALPPAPPLPPSGMRMQAPWQSRWGTCCLAARPPATSRPQCSELT